MSKNYDRSHTGICVTEKDVAEVIELLGVNFQEIDRPFVEAYCCERKKYELLRSDSALKNMMDLGVALGITQKGRRLSKNIEAKVETKISKLEVLRSKPKVS